MTSESKEDEEKKRTRKIQFYLQKHKVKIGWILVAALTTTLLGYVTPFPTVVSCDDPSIRLPYQKDTVSATTLITVGLAVPFLVMTCLEWVDSSANTENTSSLRQGLRRSWCYVGDLFVGGLFMFLINDIAKIATSEARPSFWSLCSPNITDEQCQQQYVSISWKDCTNPLNLPHARLVDTMKSFPSGHASVSVYYSLIMIVYIKQRIWSKVYPLVVVCVQMMWVVWAYICCHSRVWDNRHHWWDVVGGGLLGAFGAFLTLKYLSNWFIKEQMNEKSRVGRHLIDVQQKHKNT